MDFGSVLSSRIIRFEVGLQKKEYFVHETAISQLSQPLKTLVSGRMKEAIEGCVVWDDVDEQTFARFGKWAYTGDYEAAAPEILLESSSITTDIPGTPMVQANGAKSGEEVGYSLASLTSPRPRSSGQQCYSHGCKGHYRSCNAYCNCGRYHNSLQCDLCGDGSTSSCGYCETRKEPSKRSRMIDSFLTSKDWLSPTTEFEPRVNREACEVYTDVFLSHAYLYILGDKYKIDRLCKVSAHKLYKTLKTFVIYPGRMGGILALGEYIFENTRTDDPLRVFVIHYMTCVVEELGKEDDFQPLLQRCTELASALMVKMTERLD
jgi:hypothetical protein